MGSSPRMRGTPPAERVVAARSGIIPAYAGNTPRSAYSTAHGWDHPRVCGEHLLRLIQQTANEGSSPRMRGTRMSSYVRTVRVGIIPAYAGNTNPRQLKRFNARDHPRVCGEHRTGSNIALPIPGSSPRMRGTLPPSVRQIVPAGIIPAYAGNTSTKRSTDRSCRDHPRVCGEHATIVPTASTPAGSSPRMRGTHRPRKQGHVQPGIIPAYAGNTGWPYVLMKAGRDHPRVCGEHAWIDSGYDNRVGSSPRMRGTRLIVVYAALPYGIIPAYAGNTNFPTFMAVNNGDHPRVCGEHRPPEPDEDDSWGSSPRMRGTHTAIDYPKSAHRIIPAYAGNTNSYDTIHGRNRDHPRVCGEHILPHHARRTDAGSSPRMRGTRQPRHPQPRTHGIIPAYAGNTKPMLIWWMSPRDHPRVCGEHRLIGGRRHGAVGSSPRMRGTPLGNADLSGANLIIPAYAGNTQA